MRQTILRMKWSDDTIAIEWEWPNRTCYYYWIGWWGNLIYENGSPLWAAIFSRKSANDAQIAIFCDLHIIQNALWWKGNEENGENSVLWKFKNICNETIFSSTNLWEEGGEQFWITKNCIIHTICKYIHMLWQL